MISNNNFKQINKNTLDDSQLDEKTIYDKIDQIEKTRSILNNKINYQVERYQHKKIEAQILPDILNELEEELYEYYSSDIRANDYMLKVVESLKKSSK